MGSKISISKGGPAEVQEKGIKVKPEVMIPLVGFKKELDLQVAIVHRVAAGIRTA